MDIHNTTNNNSNNNNNNNRNTNINSLHPGAFFLELLFQGAKKTEHNDSYYERLVGNWMLTGDFPGPFAPDDIAPFLRFFRIKANTDVARDFLEVLIAKECAWLET